jgi:hypothetical protein
MAEKNLIIEKRGERSYVYCVQNIYNPVKRRTDKKKEYCGVFLGTYDAEGKPEFRKARQESAPAEIFRFRDAIDTVVANSLKSSKGLTWSKNTFEIIKDMNLIYFLLDFKRLSCKLEMFIPFATDKVYCRFFQLDLNKTMLGGKHNFEVLFGNVTDESRRFFTGNSKYQGLLSDTKYDQPEIPLVYEGTGVFAYSKNNDRRKGIRLLAESYEVIERVIIPHLKAFFDQLQLPYREKLGLMSKLCTNILSVLLQIEIPENINRSNIIIDLMSMNSRFIKIGGKWILLENRVTMPIGWLD